MNWNKGTKVLLGIFSALGMALATPQAQEFISGTVAPALAKHPALYTGLLLLLKALLTVVNPNQK